MIQCVCVVGGFEPSAQMTYGVMINMVDVPLSEGVGRRQEEKVAVSTLMLFVLGPVGSHAAVHREFICVQLRCHRLFAFMLLKQVRLIRKSLDTQQLHLNFRPCRPYFPFVFSFLFLDTNSSSASPLYSYCRPRGLIQPSGINKVHFILPVGLITEYCQRVDDFKF